MTNEPAPMEPDAPAITAERVEAVEQAIKYWIEQLIDPGRHNTLLFYRDTKTTTLRLDDADRGAVDRLVRGRPVALDELADESLDDEELAEQLRDFTKRATTIYRAAQANLEEAGLETLYLGIGLATWQVDDGSRGRPPAAPVLLMPISLNPRGRGSLRSFTVEPTGEVTLNPVLLYALAQQQVTASADEFLAGLDGLEDGEPGLRTPEEARRVFDRLGSAAHGLRGFGVAEAFVVGNFQYYKMAMVADLQRNVDALVAHPMIAAIAGDPDARRTVTSLDQGAGVAIGHSRPDLDPRDFDLIDAAEQNLILDADSSQELAIRRVLAGQSLVVQGPPGTGKSQTIANLMGALSAEGKRVLFVAEKRAALDAVKKRLDARGLGHLVFDLHGKGITKRALAQQIASALQRVRNAQPDKGSELYRAHNRVRSTLVEHHDAMHAARAPTGLSVYEMRSLITAAPPEARVRCAWSTDELAALTRSADAASDLLDDVKQYADVLTDPTTSPWATAEVTDQTLEDQIAAADEAWQTWQELLDALETIGLEPDENAGLAQREEIRHRLERHIAAAAAYRPAVWVAPLDDLARRLRPGLGSAAKRVWVWVANGAYRAARAEALRLREPPASPWTDVAGEVQRAAAAKRAWSAATGQDPPPMKHVAAAERAAGRFSQALDTLRARIPSAPSQGTGWDEADAILNALAADRKTPYRCARLHALATKADSEVLPLRSLLDALAAGHVPVELWDVAFAHARAEAAYGLVVRSDPSVQGFDGRTHDDVVARFQHTDRELLPVAAVRVLRLHGRRLIEVCNEYPDQDGNVRREAEKKSRHKSLRTLLEEAPDVLTALFPCWMASPLSVSQLLAGGTYFDVVLFDEASQVFPHDAVPSILRGRQLVVAGDRHQLPPTAFFTTAEGDSGDEAGAAEGFESLLDQTSAFLPNASLQWHYRSEDERLIAFSNRWIYHDSLVTFPGCGGGDPPLRSEVVPFRADAPEVTVSGHDEVRRVVELILEHAEKWPEESLGVIAPGVEHQRRIEFQLDNQLALRPDLDPFFDPNRTERFFIKNLERVQGDERDSVIFSVGYSKDRSGNLRHRFGPILQKEGERRLNVAVSRARRRMTVVSSFRWDEIDLRRASGNGVKFLRDYLRFAESGGVILGDEGEQPTALNPFELDVFDELTRAGLRLTPQFGSSGYRIDMVASHPDRPGRHVLAIECDGASYHSAPLARERDRLRQEILERLGWTFHRIWSTDWWNQREAEVVRAREAFDAACRAADRADASGSGDSPEEQGGEDGHPKSGNQQPGGVGPGVLVPARDRALNPYLPRGLSIIEYPIEGLVQLARYLTSDGRLYTDAELLEEMAAALAFKRKGRRIVERLTRAIEVARSTEQHT